LQPCGSASQQQGIHQDHCSHVVVPASNKEFIRIIAAMIGEEHVYYINQQGLDLVQGMLHVSASINHLHTHSTPATTFNTSAGAALPYAVVCYDKSYATI
jgi:hypothetical protein